MKYFMTFIAGLLFAVGLSYSGMTMPGKVIGFLDITGTWDISLMFVMIGAIGVYSLFFHFLKPKMAKPLYDQEFKLPTRLRVDAPLIIGAALFGAGWGLGGFCPGPAVASSLLGEVTVLVFVGTMVAGMIIGMIVQPMIPQHFYRND
ncbi:MAG: YeeE/YedE family protein [Kangiellaceae bacterium]|jgi:uncharacterized membrane protein YedE/YeeE|nr:YeeE/YedE family protein [Kangiellaceae bacterium]